MLLIEQGIGRAQGFFGGSEELVVTYSGRGQSFSPRGAFSFAQNLEVVFCGRSGQIIFLVLFP